MRPNFSNASKSKLALFLILAASVFLAACGDEQQAANDFQVLNQCKTLNLKLNHDLAGNAYCSGGAQ